MSAPSSILVIDDEAIIREVIARLLRREGYEVKTVSSGEEGLEVAREYPFDLVLLDLMLPGIGGLEVLSVFVDKHPKAVVIISDRKANTSIPWATIRPKALAAANWAFRWMGLKSPDA